jgi:hypothetical protein
VRVNFNLLEKEVTLKFLVLEEVEEQRSKVFWKKLKKVSGNILIKSEVWIKKRYWMSRTLTGMILSTPLKLD